MVNDAVIQSSLNWHRLYEVCVGPVCIPISALLSLFIPFLRLIVVRFPQMLKNLFSSSIRKSAWFPILYSHDFDGFHVRKYTCQRWHLKGNKYELSGEPITLFQSIVASFYSREDPIRRKRHYLACGPLLLAEQEPARRQSCLEHHFSPPSF